MRLALFGLTVVRTASAMRHDTCSRVFLCRGHANTSAVGPTSSQLSAGRQDRMLATMNFEKYAASGNAYVNEVADELGEPKDRARVCRSIRAVLHALRARLSIQESFHLLAQLPMVLKAVYFDGWTPQSAETRHIRSVHDLVEEMMRADGRMATHDFPDAPAAERAVRAVVGVLACHVSPGEVEAIERGLPRGLASLWRDAADRAVAAAARRAKTRGEPDPGPLSASTWAALELLARQSLPHAAKT